MEESGDADEPSFVAAVAAAAAAAATTTAATPVRPGTLWVMFVSSRVSQCVDGWSAAPESIQPSKCATGFPHSEAAWC
eukprot:COSAG01_NODE_2069_length_8498_cov_5.965841_3_plen_78_part_00